MKTKKTMTEDRRRNPDASGRHRDADESRLARWSRRKALVRAGQEPETPVVAGDSSPHAPAVTDTAAEKTDADMPPIDSLHQDSDYAAFLSPKVSEKLRRMALRKLFQLPQFNFTDGLDDYAEDYTNFAPLGDIITADMRHRMGRELEARKEERLQNENGGKHEDEKPSETVAEGNHAVESAAPEPPDESEAPSTPAAGVPKKRKDTSKG